DCKNTTDETLTNYLNSLKIKQTHFYTDVRLALGYASVIICAITFAYDYKFGFDKTKHYTVGTVILYFLLNMAFSYWIWFVEKDIIYTGNYQGRKITISSWTKKLDPTYRLKVRHASSSAGTDWKETEITAPFSRWFTADGFIVPQPFQQWLASSVPLVAEADPKN
ncbi:hypothetical protein K461DRAFT_217743, partial [Myriangium duriaei CBS 260.36]